MGEKGSWLASFGRFEETLAEYAWLGYETRTMRTKEGIDAILDSTTGKHALMC